MSLSPLSTHIDETRADNQATRAPSARPQPTAFFGPSMSSVIDSIPQLPAAEAEETPQRTTADASSQPRRAERSSTKSRQVDDGNSSDDLDIMLDYMP